MLDASLQIKQKDAVWVVEPPKGAENWLKDLCDLNQGQVFIESSSYVKEQNEVTVMIDAVKSKEHWPGGFYEKLQNAIDNNDWEKGPVEINIYLDDPDNPISYQDYLNLRENGKNPYVTQIDITNNIKDGRGLRPGHVTLTLHEQQVNQNTQGTHGRGLSITTTADISGDLAESISFKSYHPDVGTWVGEAKMMKSPADKGLPARLTLQYKRDEEHVVEKTTISIHEPSTDSLDALANLPNWYLPFNPKYELNRMMVGFGEINDIVSSEFTLFADSTKVRDYYNYDKYFAKGELVVFQNDNNQLGGDISGDPMRAEILPREIIQDCPTQINFVFVDGLRVRVPGAKFSNIYSFYGWKNANEDSNPHRSNDSRDLAGRLDYLLYTMLGHCNNMNVWKKIMVDGLEGCDRHEFKISSCSLNLNSNNVDVDVTRAFRLGWIDACKSQGINSYDPELCVAQTDNAFNEAKKKKLKPILIKSPFLAENLVSMGVLDSAENMVAQINQKIQDEQLAKIKLQEDENDVKAKALAEVTLKLEEAILKRDKVKKLSKSTGEVVMVETTGSVDVHQEQARLSLQYLMVMNGGEISRVGDNLVLKMRADDFGDLPKTVADMAAVAPFVMNFMAIEKGRCNVEVRIIKKGEGAYFEYHANRNETEDGLMGVNVFRGVPDMPDENLLQITLRPQNHLTFVDIFTGKGIIKSWEIMINGSLDPFKGSDGKVMVDRYLASQDYHNYPPLAEVIRARLRMNEIMAEKQKYVDEVNSMRRMAGLPPISTQEENKSNLKNKKSQKFIRNKSSKGAEIRIIDSGSSIHQRVLTLLSPNEMVGLSTAGSLKGARIVMEDIGLRNRLHHQMVELIETIFKQNAPPEMLLSSGLRDSVPSYLISNINPRIGEESEMLQNFAIMSGFEFGKKALPSKLRFGYSVEAGLNSLYFPPGYKPVGYYHPNGEQPIVFSTDSNETHWAYYSDRRIPPGLTFYYEKDSRVDRSIPKNNEVLVTRETLNPVWRNLVDALNSAPDMTDKQKSDILITAWVRAFHYDKSQETFDLYEQVFGKGPEFVSTVINEAVGNCGYAAMGLYGLYYLVGIPSEIVNSYLTDEYGAANTIENLHSLVKPLINDQRVYVEPQQGYIGDVFQIDDVPIQHRARIDKLIESITPSRERFRGGKIIEAVTESTPQKTSFVSEFMVGIISAAKTVNLRPPVNKVRGPKQKYSLSENTTKLTKSYLRRSLIVTDLISGLTILTAKTAPVIIETLNRLDSVKTTVTYSKLDDLIGGVTLFSLLGLTFFAGSLSQRLPMRIMNKTSPPVERLGDSVIYNAGDD